MEVAKGKEYRVQGLQRVIDAIVMGFIDFWLQKVEVTKGRSCKRCGLERVLVVKSRVYKG